MIFFDEKTHTYTDENGLKYNGVTGAIGKLLGKEFPDIEKVKVHTSFGSQVHKEVELYIKKKIQVTMQAAKKATDLIARISFVNKVVQAESEVIVTDGRATASCIDVVLYTENKEAILIDIKTGTFDRMYCTIQLQCYRKMFEMEKGIKVKKLFIISTKDEIAYTISLDTRPELVDAVFEMNRRALDR